LQCLRIHVLGCGINFWPAKAVTIRLFTCFSEH
jgi:hypothetical protein